MKKNIIKATFVAAIAMVCGVSFLNTQKSETLSEVALANVEALADNGSRVAKVQCSGNFIVCNSDKASFLSDIANNCDEFTGHIEFINCPES